ncbi:MAG TPA: 3-deoxy-D-manno-octulosonic acid transferase, partial [Rhodobacter sp.]|nr:3-deoxy-D-manno-octulosonic acid transferase [Rhodobacter sp.]
AHRLLLIIVPREAARVPALEALILSQKNWGVGLEARNELPNQEIEVLIAGPEAYGLWYRLSPITFLGGSLYGEGCARNPFEAAAMGSALMHGPRPGAFGTYLGRLGAARAAVAVSTGQDLHEALTDLLSPDRAALHAQAAWAVASNGVDVTDQVVEMVRSAIGEA